MSGPVLPRFRPHLPKAYDADRPRRNIPPIRLLRRPAISSPADNKQMEFLEHLGYRTEKNHKIKIVNTSILGADSLLGVKYILSDYPVRGLEAINQFKKGGTKKVYLNKSAFPLAFVVNGDLKEN